MENSNPQPQSIDKIIEKLKIFTSYKEEKPRLLVESISNYLIMFPEIKNYINENNQDNESKIFFELSKNLKYSKYHKGKFIKHSYDLDNYFFIIFSGDIAKIDIKYNRIYISFKEYLTHLIKLKLLNENYIYMKCIKKNNKTFPLNDKFDVLKLEDSKNENYQQLIKTIKEKIKNSSWLNNNNKTNNIQDFLSLYNPEILNIKISFMRKETRYPAFLPFYILDKVLSPISFIGQLSKPIGIKFSSAYITLSNCDIFYINKNEISQNNNLYNLFQRKISEDIIKKLFEGHHFFKDTDKSFLIKNYIKYFYVKKLKKGQKIIRQNTPHEGIYFIKNGVFQLQTLRSYNDLNNLHFSILHALDNYPKTFMLYQNKIKKLEKQNIKNEFEKKIFEGLNQSQISKFSEIKNIPFKTFNSPEVVGFNDIYDYKTGLNNFSVECISEEGEVYFLPKEIVTSMLTEENMNANISEYIGKQCLLLINEINKYKDSFEKIIQLEKNKKLNENTKKKNHSFYSLNLNNISNLSIDKNNNYLSNLKPKKNHSTGFDNYINNNTFFLSNKIINDKNIYNFNEIKMNKTSFNKKGNNSRYNIYPKILLTQYNNKDKYDKVHMKLKIDDSKETKSDNNFHSLKYIRPKFKSSSPLKKKKINSEVYLTEKNNINMKNIIMGENSNELNYIKNQFRTNFDNFEKRKLIFNKSFNKGFINNIEKNLNSQNNFFKLKNYENNKNIIKYPINIFKISYGNKRLINNRSLFISNKESKNN